MAAIQERIGKDGKKSFRVLIRRKGQPLQTMTFTSKTLAKQWAIKVEAEIQLGKVFKASPSKQKTIAEMIDRYIENVLPTKGLSSQVNQKLHLTWWKAKLGDLRLSTLSRAIIIEKRDELAASTFQRHNKVKKYSSATVDRYIDALSSALTTAVYDWEWLNVHPLRGYKVKFNKDNARTRYLTNDEQVALWKACQHGFNPIIHDIILLAITTGTPAAWQRHGRYALKGIAEPIEVYEAYNPKRVTPRAPPGAVQDGGHSKFRMAIAATALAVIVATATFFGLRFVGGTPEISLVDYNSDWAKMWDGTPFRVGGEPGQHIRPVLTPLKPGHYLLTADTSQIVRFFAPFDVARDKNVLEIRFERDELPGISRRMEYEKGAENKLQESREETYFSYDANMQRHEHKAKIAMSLAAAPDAADEKKINFTCAWTITLDGKEISAGKAEDSHRADDMETARPPHKILWSDDFHFYYLSYYMSGSSAEFSIEANFADYKDK